MLLKCVHIYVYKRTVQVFGRSVISMGMSKYFSISCGDVTRRSLMHNDDDGTGATTK